MFTVKLKKGREKSVINRHPWIFSGALQSSDTPAPTPGATVTVLDSHDQVIGTGAWSPESMIQVRMWSFDPEEKIDKEFFRNRITCALQLRDTLGMRQAEGACRIIAGESDGLPGLTVDFYAGFLVCQFQSCGVEAQKSLIVEVLNEILKPEGIYERSDTSARKKEMLEDSIGLLYGSEPPEHIIINDKGLKFKVDVRTGHKTGFYLDQRDNRYALSNACKGREVLNCFSYTGAFSAWAMNAGAAKVTDIDSSENALSIAAENYTLNGFAPERYEQICGDVFTELRKFRDSRRSFDVIVLDPPKFADTKGKVHKAARAYKDINMLAMKLLRENGRLFTFSCSGAISAELFQKIAADAAIDAKRDVKIVRRLFQAPDHPVALNYPESLYLKGMECVVC
eukprot:TRINITY_DN8598_c0_g1_i1.p1 TRINITY_DN8598_c0_g1~~TRINITY_DN8598_c0_g1_i1.p1  ORF type:complete len:397 (-),score=91.15 TRINITY_DN8598_c0_g1_i1:151-1341(-)